MIRGIRGATTVSENSADEILNKTEMLLKEMVEENRVEPSDIASILITVTDEIDAVFPAKALRRLVGFTFVPVTCAREIPVPNSLSHCIRVMMTVNTNLAPHEIKHIYQERAIDLRPDLRLTNSTEL
ncbi:chorismate mutase [Bacillus mesophilus]|uniref:chorismate mutase n=1 Tax=Bacillus mesophilus TaxID=1808955 RepID=A0A6M0Q4R5_9BACI|nr:chorismate mutase [Bacillus mesophilus]MBM7661251.1 chorismate mutase [Bacillus mesophilus]NEY71224.1 chorismate mutase [Bacillus mesophilus]